ncbi:MAG: BrnT family toxin [Sulfuricellaceae bacterium]
MEITYDPAKDVANQAKHGVSLALAAKLEWDTLWAEQDTRHAYHEVRMIGYALIGTRLYCVVYTERGGECRIISLRKANPREVGRYVSEI